MTVYKEKKISDSVCTIALSGMVICLTLYFFRHTNELQNSALTTQQKFFICSFEYLVCFWCCKTHDV